MNDTRRGFGVDYGVRLSGKNDAEVGEIVVTPLTLRGKAFYRVEQYQVINGEVRLVFIGDQYLTEPLVKGDQAFHLYQLAGPFLRREKE